MLFAAVAVILLIAVVRASYCWTSDAWVNHPAGVLIAMAADLKDGIFYRPLYGPEGYGGTRYFPLYFVLHALLMKLGVPVLLGAYLLSAAAMVSLLAGVFYLLRGLGVEPWLAACSAATVLAVLSRAVVAGESARGWAGKFAECMGPGGKRAPETWTAHDSFGVDPVYVGVVGQDDHSLRICRNLYLAAEHRIAGNGLETGSRNLLRLLAGRHRHGRGQSRPHCSDIQGLRHRRHKSAGLCVRSVEPAGAGSPA